MNRMLAPKRKFNPFSMPWISTISANIINLAGFGNGIGSGRSSGYGRYHVDGIK